MQVGKGVELFCGDCLAILPTFAENSIDSCVTDPPYHLQSIVDRFGANGAKPPKTKQTGVYKRIAKGFMGETWDGGDIAFDPETWKLVLRVMKPGAHLLAFNAARNYHMMATAIEAAGFQIRDCIVWAYAQGMPKSSDIGKQIDRKLGAKREIVGAQPLPGRQLQRMSNPNGEQNWTGIRYGGPVTEEAEEWDDWNVSLKPAIELIALARKPLSEPSIVANVQRWGTGALNIGACRVGEGFKRNTIKDSTLRKRYDDRGSTNFSALPGLGSENGRWPANLIHDGSDEVVGMFPQTRPETERVLRRKDSLCRNTNVNIAGRTNDISGVAYAGGGSAARLFYAAKADKMDRAASDHATVKPVDLMQYLVRLATPPGGTVLDLFAGSGTTGEAAILEGMKAVLIEKQAAFQEDIKRRMRTVNRPFVRRNEIAKRNAELPHNALPRWLRS